MEDEIIPREIIGEIMKRSSKITLVDFMCTCTWIRDLILNEELEFMTTIRLDSWSDDIKRACKAGDHVSLVRLKVDLTKWWGYERESFVQKVREGLRIACMRGHLGIVKNLYRRIVYATNYPLRVLSRMHGDIFKVACCKGHAHIVRWLFEMIVPLGDEHDYIRRKFLEDSPSSIQKYMTLTFRSGGSAIVNLFGHFKMGKSIQNLLRERKYYEILMMLKSLGKNS